MRALISRHRAVAAWLLAIALALRILVPAGYMPVASASGVAFRLCPGSSPVATAKPTHHDMAASTSHDAAREHDRHAPAVPADTPCAFTGLAAPSLQAIGMALPAALLALPGVFAADTSSAFASFARTRLRPPLRAPPVPR